MYRYVGYLPSSDKARFPEICDEVRSHKPHFPEKIPWFVTRTVYRKHYFVQIHWYG